MTIGIQFHPGLTIEGSVVWCKDGEVGVQFSRTIDVDQVLSDLARNLIDGKVNRAPRLQLHCKAELSIGSRTLAIELRDISQRGIKAFASFVQPGDEVQVRLVGLEPRKAMVRWTQPGLAGLNFLRPLSFEELARWVSEHQESRWASSNRAVWREAALGSAVCGKVRAQLFTSQS